jgi:hypothetical protein
VTPTQTNKKQKYNTPKENERREAQFEKIKIEIEKNAQPFDIARVQGKRDDAGPLTRRGTGRVRI